MESFQNGAATHYSVLFMGVKLTWDIFKNIRGYSVQIKKEEDHKKSFWVLGVSNYFQVR